MAYGCCSAHGCGTPPPEVLGLAAALLVPAPPAALSRLLLVPSAPSQALLLEPPVNNMHQQQEGEQQNQHFNSHLLADCIRQVLVLMILQVLAHCDAVLSAMPEYKPQEGAMAAARRCV